MIRRLLCGRCLYTCAVSARRRYDAMCAADHRAGRRLPRRAWLALSERLANAASYADVPGYRAAQLIDRALDARSRAIRASL